ncbi:MAG: hypothetical protein M1546_15685 [Chloroflexi bacterium]|nr:hypothetical protein [Chloroflexota bacterium]
MTVDVAWKDQNYTSLTGFEQLLNIHSLSSLANENRVSTNNHVWRGGVVSPDRPVLYLGGFMGQDAVETTESLARMVTGKELRYQHRKERNHMKHTIGKMIIVAGIAFALVGCGAGGSSGATQPDAAGAPPDSTPGRGGQNQMSPGVTGKVISVDGSKITVEDQRQQSTITVALTDSTQVFKQMTIDLANVPAGESISAVGNQEGDVFTATQVQIGTAGGPSGNNPGERGQQGGNAANGGQAPPEGTAQPGRGLGGRLFGTVEQVSGDTMTVKTTDGSTVQVRLATDGKVVQQVAGTSADITAGVQVSVMGEQNDTTMTAARITIVPATSQQP